MSYPQLIDSTEYSVVKKTRLMTGNIIALSYIGAPDPGDPKKKRYNDLETIYEITWAVMPGGAAHIERQDPLSLEDLGYESQTSENLQYGELTGTYTETWTKTSTIEQVLEYY